MRCPECAAGIDVLVPLLLPSRNHSLVLPSRPFSNADDSADCGTLTFEKPSVVRIRNNIVDAFDEVLRSTIDENTLGMMFLSGWVVAGMLTGMMYHA